VETVATTGEGVDRLKDALAALAGPDAGPAAAPPAPNPPPLRYDGEVEAAVASLEGRLRGEGIPPGWAARARGLALLLLQGDGALLAALPPEHPARLRAEALLAADPANGGAPDGSDYAQRIALVRQARARELAARHLRSPDRPARTLADWLGEAAAHPLTGVPLLLGVLYLGLYQFVGVFAAGTVVDWLETGVFARWVHPWVNGALATLLPGDAAWAYWGRELIGGEYGVITLGVTYAAAIVLPIVSLFFLFFSVLEDSGYFPRLAMLVDRLFRGIGLNGRAVIPLVLGFGCDTMATLVTRIQETRRERLITTFLLALAVPCSAQYGVITGLLARQPQGVLGVSYAFLAWSGLMLGVFLVAGRVVSRVLPGPPPDFFMELPPLRWPRPANVLSKTAARLRWYFAEILPLFVLASVLIWLGRLTRVFDVVIAGMERVVGVLGLPPAAAEAFLYGFFRRDFGAAGLYRLAGEGQLDAVQLLVASVTLTLFLPCIAQFLVMKREHGLRISLAMAGVVSVTAFGVGAVLYRLLLVTGVQP
jgi:ferrous iron transport protein B